MFTYISVLFLIEAMLIGVFVFLIYLLLRSNQSCDTGNQNGLTRMKDTSYGILKRAIKQANAILVSSELRGIRLVAKQKLENEKIARLYTQEFQSLDETMKGEFIKRIEQMDAGYKAFLQTLEKTLTARMEDNQSDLRKEMKSLSEKANQTIEAFNVQIKEDIKTNITHEFTKTHEMIEAYKNNRMRIVDANIFTILEGTLSLMLGKTISLKDQSELVYKALDQAKKDGVFDDLETKKT